MSSPALPTLPPAIASTPRPVHVSHLWAEGHFSFHDLIDAVNPLQHLPIVSMIYRAVTGEHIGNAARVVGDALYGGVIGFAVGVANAVSVDDTGKDLGERAIALLTGEHEGGAAAKSPAEIADRKANAPKLDGSEATRTEQDGSGANGAKAPVDVATAPGQPTAGAPTLSIEDALARLPQRPAIDLSFFPGANAATPPAPAARLPSVPGAARPTVGPPPAQPGAPRLAPLPGAPASVPGNVSPPPATAPSGATPVPVAAAKPAIALPARGGIAIDTSPAGILAMRAKSGSGGIPLELSGGAFLAQGFRISAADASGSAAATQAHSAAAEAGTAAGAPAAVPPAQADFLQRMQRGIDKYTALKAMQPAGGSAGSGAWMAERPSQPARGTAPAAAPASVSDDIRLDAAF